MKIQYQKIALRTAVVAIIEQANMIIEESQADGFKLTLRQLYYQFIARDWFPASWIDPEYNRKHGLDPDTKNTDKNYQRLGSIISQGRRAGLIDWNAIVDRTRFLRDNPYWRNPQHFVDLTMPQFRLNLWDDQQYYVELWFEKDALLEVFERAAEAQRLPLCSNRGYMSDSTVWEAAQRITRMADEEAKQCVVLHFGDHDPSGLDMTRDLQERFDLFQCEVRVQRIALTMGQVRRYKCPPNPAKETDSRFQSYKRLFGDRSWELDALNPGVMVNLVVKAAEKYIDRKKWDAVLAREREGLHLLDKVSRHWPKLERLFTGKRWR